MLWALAVGNAKFPPLFTEHFSKTGSLPRKPGLQRAFARRLCCDESDVGLAALGNLAKGVSECTWPPLASTICREPFDKLITETSTSLAFSPERESH